MSTIDPWPELLDVLHVLPSKDDRVTQQPSIYNFLEMAVWLATLSAVCLYASSAQAKGYRNGYTPPVRDPSTLYFNSNTTLLEDAELPTHFDWYVHAAYLLQVVSSGTAC